VPSDETAYVGDTLQLEGRNLPAQTGIDIVWHSSDGRWGVLKDNEIVGPQYRSRTNTIGTVSTDANGQFSYEWTIPEDYGGDHTIELQRDGETLAEAEVTITPWFEIDRTEAEMGETFTITGYGIGPDDYHNNYQITWDGAATGFVTGVQNRGTATAQIRAVGPPGEHIIQVYRNTLGVPFLQNNTQSAFGPVAGGRQSVWQVEVTIPTDIGATKPVVAEVDGQSVAVTGFMMQPKIETFSPTSGPMGTEVEIELSGIGWTKYECTPYFVYDNRPLGYICSNIGSGTNVQEVVRAAFRAYGEPGFHFIDVYPALFEMQDDQPDFALKPHLSYLDNHPVRSLPAMHFTFEVTE